jgi:hypothetical protein
MASTPSSNSALELMVTGEKSGQWGDITNTNLQIIDRATKGVGTITLATTSYSLDTVDFTPSEGHFAVLVFAGTPGGTCTVTINPNDQQKVFIVRNTTPSSVVLTQGSGGNVTVPAGRATVVYATGGGSGSAVVDVTPLLEVVFPTGVQTLTNKTIDLSSNTLTGTITQFNTALSDGSFATLAGTETLTNKTLTSPALTSPTLTGAPLVNGSYRSNLTAVSALDIDCSLGNYFTKSISANSTFTFSNVPSSTAYGFMLRVTTTGAPTISWPAAVRFPDDVPPALVADRTHLFVFITDNSGTTWRGAALTNYTA